MCRSSRYVVKGTQWELFTNAKRASKVTKYSVLSWVKPNTTSKSAWGTYCKVTEKLKQDFDAATSQMQASLAHAAVANKIEQSTAEAPFQ